MLALMFDMVIIALRANLMAVKSSENLKVTHLIHTAYSYSVFYQYLHVVINISLSNDMVNTVRITSTVRLRGEAFVL